MVVASATKFTAVSGRTSLWSWAVLAASVFALLPLNNDTGIFSPALADWNLPQRIYQLIKPSILWAALGLVGGMAGYGREVRLCGLVGLALLGICSPFLTEPFRVRDAIEILALLPGLALGLWLGERARLLTPSPGVGAGHARDQGARFRAERLEPDLGAPHGSDPKGFPLSGRAHGALLLSLSLLAVVGWTLSDFPRWNLALGAGFLAYLAVLWRYPSAWLVVLPAALPVLDLAFWTGRFYFDEFDLLLLVTLAAWLWHRRSTPGDAAPWPKVSWLLALSVVLSAAVALYPLPPLDANSFSSYWSEYNAFRLAKGFLWGGLIFFMARSALRDGVAGLLSMGMVLGLLGASLAALWEASLFTGFGAASDYRVTGSFSSMHTGGGHIEAYLAAALPFAWFLLVSDRRSWVRLVAVVAFLLAGYAILTTVARAGLVAFVAVAAVLGLVSVRSLARRAPKPAGNTVGLVVLAAAVLVVAAGVASGTYLKERIEQTVRDAGIRFDHWAATIRLMDKTPRAWFLGEGLGSFPRRFLFSHTDLPLGAYQLSRESSDNAYLRLNSGGTLYMAQALHAEPHTAYTVELDIRSDGKADRLEWSLCEKRLFNSHRCAWGGSGVDARSGEWQHLNLPMDSGEVGAGAWFARRPIQFSLYNPTERTAVDIDNVRLLGPEGRDQLVNGDFGAGLDRWFFKSGDHLPWHIKNLWVHTLFEQGLLGLIALGALVLVAGVRLTRTAWRGDAFAATLLASLAAFMVLSVVDSLVDAPRLAALLAFVLLCGAGTAPGLRVGARRARDSRRPGA